MIIVRLMGGLGNQMFQYAAGKALADRLGVSLQLDRTFLDQRSENPGYTLRNFELDVFQISAGTAEKSVVALTDKEAKNALEHLVKIGLVYPSEDGMRLPTQLRDVIGIEPAGLGPASMAKLKMSDLDDAPVDAKKVLDRLIWGPPRGSVGDI